MKLLVQRVKNAKVVVENKIVRRNWKRIFGFVWCHT